MGKVKAMICFGLVTLLALTGSGCSKQPATTGAANKAAVMINSTRVKTGTLFLNNTVNGKLEAWKSANIVAKSSGKVANIAVDVGTEVTAGQVLISLEADDLAAALRLAEAGVENAQVAYDLALKQYERGKELHDAGAISQADFDNNYRGVLDKARASLKSAQASADQARVRLNDAFIKSPLAGVVTARNINPGEQAGSAATLITVMNLDEVVVNINVLEDQVNRLNIGQEVKVAINAVSEKPFAGVVTNIAAAASSSTKVFPVRIKIDNSDHQLKPGMFAAVTFNIPGKSGLLVPNTAVTSYNGLHKLFLIKDDIARDTPVLAGDADAENTLIISGVNEGDEVVVNGTEATLKDGVAIKRRQQP